MQPLFTVGDDSRSPDAPFAGTQFLDQDLPPRVLLAKRDLATLTNHFNESLHTLRLPKKPSRLAKATPC